MLNWREIWACRLIASPGFCTDSVLSLGDTALQLAHFFGMSAQFWLNLQDAFAVYHARKKYSKELKAIKTLAAGTATRRGAVRTDIPAAKM